MEKQSVNREILILQHNIELNRKALEQETDKAKFAIINFGKNLDEKILFNQKLKELQTGKTEFKEYTRENVNEDLKKYSDKINEVLAETTKRINDKIKSFNDKINEHKESEKAST